MFADGWADEVGAIFIAVKFGSSAVNFASSVLPLTLRIIGSENRIRPTQFLLGEFITAYNLKSMSVDGNTDSLTQVWYTPTASNNFSPIKKGFRTLFSVSGMIVVGQGTVDLETFTYITDDGQEEAIASISSEEGYQASANPQPFGNTKGFAVSEINFGTDAITISTYLLDSQLVADCMSAKGMVQSSQDGRESTKGMNDVFKIKIKYSNGFTNESEANPNLMEYKLISCRIGKKIGEIPSFIASFSY